jgi:hypothetical protein
MIPAIGASILPLIASPARCYDNLYPATRYRLRPNAERSRFAIWQRRQDHMSNANFHGLMALYPVDSE